MNVNWLSLRDMEYVVKVAKLLSFGRAANACGVSQPALSLQIKKIEGYLGARLFERTKREVFVTDLGNEFVARAKKVLSTAQSFAELTRPQTPFTVPFRIGAIRTSGPYLMPWVLPRFFKEFKNGQLLIREGLTEELIELLRSGELDAVIASPTFEEGGLSKIDLFYERFHLVLPKFHELVGKKHLSVRDLDTSQMVLLEDGHCLKDQIVSICSTKNSAVMTKYHATSLETLKQLVAASQGYTFFPELAINKDRLDSLVTYREVTGKKVGRVVSYFHRKESTREEEHQHLTSLIRSSLPSVVNPLATAGKSDIKKS